MAERAQVHGAARMTDAPAAAVSLMTEDLDSAEARTRWADTLNSLYCEMDVTWPQRRGSFSGHWAGHRFGELHVSAIDAELHTVDRTPSMIKSDGNRDFLLCMVAEGFVEVSQDGRTSTLTEGSFGLLDCSKPFRYDCPSQFRQVVVRAPHGLITARMAHQTIAEAVGRAIPSSSGPGRIVASVLTEIASAETDMSAGAALAFSSSAIDMLAVAVTESAVFQNPTAAAHSRDLATAKQALTSNLHDPDYSLVDVAGEVGMSTRYIQTLFASAGTTPRTWLQHARLDRARNQLLTTDCTIAEVAAQTGFRDVSHFSRSFRARFGASPGYYRAEQLN